MESTTTVILSSGGLRSLIATAIQRSEDARRHIILLHILDGRANTKVRSQYIHRQAQHFDINQTIELELPRLKYKLPIRIKLADRSLSKNACLTHIRAANYPIWICWMSLN